MDFTNRSTQQQTNHAGPTMPSASAAPAARNEKPKRKNMSGKWVRFGGVLMLFCLTILAVAAIAVLYFGGSDQAKFVSSKKYQAVFLTNGQVYFGNIKEMGSDYVRLQNIYYLTQDTTTANGQTTATGNYTLVKLGCQQIHDPYDEMIIDRTQVSFWENLQDNGKVVSSIKQFQQQNPNGPDCSKVSNQTQASSDSSAQGSTTGTGSSSSTKKP